MDGWNDGRLEMPFSQSLKHPHFHSSNNPFSSPTPLARHSGSTVAGDF